MVKNIYSHPEASVTNINFNDIKNDKIIVESGSTFISDKKYETTHVNNIDDIFKN